MTTVAITGARGFLGTHCTRELIDHGHTVVGFGRDAAGELAVLDDDGRPTESGGPDLADRLAGAGAVVHLAGSLSLGPNTPVRDYLDANVGLTERVAEAAAAAGCRAVVYSSSRLVYPADLDRPAREDDVRPGDGYGLSKWMAEQALAFQARRHGLATVSLRLSQLVGPGDGGRGVLARFADRAGAGEPVEVAGSGSAVRDFLDVRDAAHAVRLAVEALVTDGSAALPPALNIGGGPRTIRELAEIACDAVGADHDLIEHREVDTDDTSCWALDTSRAAAALGWQPAHPLVEALGDRAG